MKTNSKNIKSMIDVVRELKTKGALIGMNKSAIAIDKKVASFEYVSETLFENSLINFRNGGGFHVFNHVENCHEKSFMVLGICSGLIDADITDFGDGFVTRFDAVERVPQLKEVRDLLIDLPPMPQDVAEYIAASNKWSKDLLKRLLGGTQVQRPTLH